MRRFSAFFFQTVIGLIGVGALTFMVWEPHLEGRNAHATLFEVYFKDPFLAYAYVASMPFFMALYEALKVVGYARRAKVISPAAVKSLRTIRYCALATVGFVAGGEALIMVGTSDDRSGGVVIGLAVAFGSLVAAAAAAMLEGVVLDALGTQTEKNLTT